jgi:hypothetical protein
VLSTEAGDLSKTRRGSQQECNNLHLDTSPPVWSNGVMTFDEYLNQPCDEDDCERTADHNGTGRSGKRGQWCNQHINWDQPAFARND